MECVGCSVSVLMLPESPDRLSGYARLDFSCDPGIVSVSLIHSRVTTSCTGFMLVVGSCNPVFSGLLFELGVRFEGGSSGDFEPDTLSMMLCRILVSLVELWELA